MRLITLYALLGSISLLDIDPRRIKLIMDLRRRGIADPRVLDAIERTPREMFVPNALRDAAYDDRALPIDCDQTISQPYIVAYMTEQAKIDDRCKLLEIGTGSGYQTAILSRLARRVYTIERHPRLAKTAEAAFETLGLANIVPMIGDGAKGWPAQAPFDRILVTAAAPARPAALLDQLKEGGVLIAPVGEGGAETLIRYEKAAEGVREERLLPVRFVPLREGVAEE